MGSTRRGGRHCTDHQSTSHQMPGKRSESSHNHLHKCRQRHDSHRSANLVARSVRSRVGRWQRRCRRAEPRKLARIGVFSAAGPKRACASARCVRFRAVRAIAGGRVLARAALMCPSHEKAMASISRRFSHIASQASREALSAEREASPLPCRRREASKWHGNGSSRVW